MEMCDVIVRYVPHYGYLPIVTIDEKEVYRGEFQSQAYEAFDLANIRLRRYLLGETA